MPTPYDELPYPGAAYAQTHPDRLAVMATLFGLAPPPVERCRVLELACGDGGNLIPMAFTLPGSRFLGIDLAESAIAKGRELIQTLHLTNICLKAMNLMDVGEEIGQFDYIIAHGIYSWVPAAVRERILDLCKSHLAPNGVGFISYNTYPGGHFRDTIREMMKFHTRHLTDPAERVERAREFLRFLAEGQSKSDAYAVFLQSELQSFLERKPEHFYHDELSEYNDRFYFHEFVDQVSHHGLQYLSAAGLANMQTGTYSPAILEKLQSYCAADELIREQYLDFLTLRNFRQTLICHADVPLDRRMNPSRVRSLAAASEATPASPDPDLRTSAAQEFCFSSGGKMSTNHPLAKAAMMHLGAVWPRPVQFGELLETSRRLTSRNTDPATPLDEDSNWLSDMVLKLNAANFLDLHVYSPPLVNQPSERPAASALARAQVLTRSEVTNLRHASVKVEDEGARQLLLLLDGTRDRSQLLDTLRELLHAPDIASEQLENNLTRLAKLALLTA
ncbi:MAG TPA: class I SAM-dependent methyltransferase [Bryobacteraceae bacterium]|nr:class I SAM-dependent methyltransferase [Bryobacteraceae bacterium]